MSSKDEYEFALDLAGLELNRQRYERAEGLLQKLRKIDREDTRVYRLLAQVYEAQKKRIWHWSHGNKSINQLIRR
ncbi:MAG: tetratricopeptide repeat protein [Pseudomonadota bacterium]|nr:tetratricopeptide repeat protein [Pseudomonadota bacterium]